MIRRFILLAGAVMVLGLPTSAAAHATTTETIFHAFTSTGSSAIPTRSKSGYCYTGSLTINRYYGTRASGTPFPTCLIGLDRLRKTTPTAAASAATSR
jgi:hypothetical protein